MDNICNYTYDPNILTQAKVNRQFTMIHKYLCFLAAGGGGGGTSDVIQTISTGVATTVTDGVNKVRIDPPTPITNFSLTLPATPSTGNTIEISFGGTITTGTVVTNFTLLANTGQSIIQAIPPVTGTAGSGAIVLSWWPDISKWETK